MDYEFPYFDDEPEYYHDAYGDTEELEKKVGTPLTIAEIKEFMTKRTHVTYDKQDMELLVDEQTGLLYTEELNASSAEPLINHCLVEQCFEHEDKVDWERVTDKYDYKIIEKIEHIYTYPLTWVYPAEEIGRKYFVWGLIAAPKPCEDRYSLSSNFEFFSNVRELAIRWFATTLPTKNDIRGVGRDYHLVPDDMILWDRICSYGNDYYSRNAIFRAETLRMNIEFIAENFGGARAAKIIRLLQADWQDIVIRKLFDINKLSPEQIEEFRQNLFEGMDRNLRKWETETAPKNETPQTQTPQKPTVDLESVFSLRFRRTDEYNRLLQFLESERLEASDPDWARYALALYEANIFVRRPARFTQWLPKFCELFGRQVAYREPCSLRRTPCQKDITVYLPNW